MYKVYASQGQGFSEKEAIEFPSLEEAIAYVELHTNEASFGIKYPDGFWHKW